MLDHVGGPLGIGGYAGRRDEVFAGWRAAIRELASCPNVCVKLGGLGMRINGFGFHEQRRAAVLGDAGRGLAALHRDLHRGVRRRRAACSRATSPSTRARLSYGVFWNACKRLAAGASAAEQGGAVQRHGQRGSTGWGSGTGAARCRPHPDQPRTLASSSAVRPSAMVAARASQECPPMRAKAWSTPG